MERPKRHLLAIAMVILLAVGALGARGVVAQEDPDAQATIEALETQVSELQTQIADLDSGAESPTEEAGKAAPNSGASGTVFGPGVEFLPAGTDGEVEVVLAGEYDGTRLPYVVRNNTGETVSEISVSSTVKSADGKLIAAGGSLDIKPRVVPAGGYAIGYLYFDGVDLASDVTFAYDVEYEEGVDTTFVLTLDLEFSDVAYLDGRLVGEAINSGDETASGPFSFSVVCLSSDGALLDYWDGFADKETADPGETIPFQVEDYSDVDCSNFVIAGRGYLF